MVESPERQVLSGGGVEVGRHGDDGAVTAEGTWAMGTRLAGVSGREAEEDEGYKVDDME